MLKRKHWSTTKLQKATDRVSHSVQDRIREYRHPSIESACYAPHSALYFRPDGGIQACCATGLAVGWANGPRRSTLKEIWEGPDLRVQREALQAGEFDLGCQECELAIEAAGRETSLASHFDRWRVGSPHDYPQLLDFALSNRCNLECVMCNGDLSSTIRTKREGRPPLQSAYDDAFFDELAVFVRHAERLQFKGGEPFLAPENRRIWDQIIAEQLDCEVTITTNGTIWNDRVEHYVRAMRADVLVSVDGVTAETLDSIRVGAHCDALWATIDKFAALTREVGSELTLSFCLMTTNWHELPGFLAEVDRRRVSCYVILVNQPHEFDLLRLPPEELEHALTTIEAAGPSLSTDPTRREWARVTQRLQAQLDHPVELKVSINGRRLAVVDEQAVATKSREWGNEPPMVITAIQDEVREIDVPDWARPLDPDRWIGRDKSQLPSLLGETMGVAPVMVVQDCEWARVFETFLTFDTDPGRSTMQIFTVPVDDATLPTERWYISRRDDAR